MMLILSLQGRKGRQEAGNLTAGLLTVYLLVPFPFPFVSAFLYHVTSSFWANTPG